MTPENTAELLACDDVDGALVGGASLDAAKFVAIVKAAGQRWPGDFASLCRRPGNLRGRSAC